MAPSAKVQVVAAPAKPAPAKPPVKVNPANELATATGAIYENVHVEKVESDGMIISYTPARGGVAMTKVYFDDLSAEARQRYQRP